MLCCTSIWSQDSINAKDAIMRMQQSYASLEYYATDFDVTVISSGVTSLSYHGQVRQGPDFYYSNILNQERFANKQMYVIVNHEDKSVHYTNLKGSNHFDSIGEEVDLSEIKQLLEKSLWNETEYHIEGGQIFIDVVLNDPYYNLMTLGINLHDYTLSLVRYEGKVLDDGGRDIVTITYSNTTINEKINKRDYNPSSVIQEKGGSLTLTHSFTSYELIY